jgi:hypothetical protein
MILSYSNSILRQKGGDRKSSKYQFDKSRIDRTWSQYCLRGRRGDRFDVVGKPRLSGCKGYEKGARRPCEDGSCLIGK